MELTIDDLRSLINPSTSTTPQPTSTFVGSKVLIRTVTFYYTGMVVAVTDKWIVLKDAAWIANTGKFSTALKSGTLNEIEPYPDGPVWVAMSAVVDVCEWNHDLPRVAK